MAIRTSSMKNFKGDRYITDKELGDMFNFPTGTSQLIGDDGKISSDLLPKTGVDLKFNGTTIEEAVTEINFTGTTTLTKTSDGKVKVQVGENQSSCSWTLADDGKVGNGTVVNNITTKSGFVSDDANFLEFSYGDWEPGKAVSTFTTASTLQFNSTSYIHFNEGQNLWDVKVYGADGTTMIEAKVTDTVTYTKTGNTVTGATFATSSVTYTKGMVNCVTHSLSDKALEDNYPSAVGARAKATFVISLDSVLLEGGRFKVVISGCGGVFNSADYVFVDGVAPSINEVTLALSDTTSTKTVSGVTYYKQGTNFNVSASGISNINYPGYVANGLIASSDTISTSTIATTSLTGWTNDGEVICSYDATLGLKSDKNVTSVACSLQPENVYSKGTSKTDTVSSILVNTYAETNPTDASENFLTETKRLQSNLTSPWSSSTTLVGIDALQVVPGVGLKYPVTDYSSYVPAENPNYSGMTGMKYYYRKFVNGTGTKTGGTLTMTGLTSAVFTDETFEAKLSIDGGTSWFNLKADRGGNDATGILVSFNATTGAISFTFPGTTVLANATTGVLLKVGWSDALSATAVIKSITLAM